MPHTESRINLHSDYPSASRRYLFQDAHAERVKPPGLRQHDDSQLVVLLTQIVATVLGQLTGRIRVVWLTQTTGAP